jgi:hypothetical protein
MGKLKKDRNIFSPQKKMAILRIKNIIKEKNEVKLEKLIAILIIDEPFMSKETAVEILKQLRIAEIIKINKKNMVSLCQ